MEFALIRHTRCDIAAGTCYGQLDIPLASTAAADIEQTLSRVPPVDLVFSSPSQRCQTLAQAIAHRDTCVVQTRPDLRELSFGAWEGVRWADILRASSDEWAMDTWHRAPPDGESESQLWHRVARATEEFLRLEGVNRIAVVSHGGPLRHLRCLLTGIPSSERWSWSCECGDVTRVTPRATARTAERVNPDATIVALACVDGLAATSYLTARTRCSPAMAGELKGNLVTTRVLRVHSRAAPQR
jgi:alpha-ribazole phosphatase